MCSLAISYCWHERIWMYHRLDLSAGTQHPKSTKSRAAAPRHAILRMLSRHRRHSIACCLQEVLDWFEAKGLEAYSISFGPSLLYNTMFPKHKDRLGTKLSELVGTVAKTDIPAAKKHFDVVVACEDEDGEDIDVPLLSIQFR